ncbi:hypothetical protein [Schnuerera ultunensis]|uniref:hypothetical protein n=1 Tax=Schnuerera ultunensis TaxID=45497 RepID=UPI001F25CA2E|nr:hypothetical protein [Schnuerera ultunensis]
MATTLKTFLESCDYECKKKTLMIFTDMTMDSNMDNVIIAFEEGIKCGAREANGIWRTYLRLNSGSLPEVDISLPNTVPKLDKYFPNITQYDQLIGKTNYKKSSNKIK